MPDQSHRANFHLTGFVQELINSKDRVLPLAVAQARAKPTDPEVRKLLTAQHLWHREVPKQPAWAGCWGKEQVDF